MLLHPPSSVVATWPTPNYDNPVTRGPARIILCAIFIPIVCIFVGLRFYTRLVMTKNLGRDDTFIGIATVLTIALNLVIILCDVKFFGRRHTWDIPSTDNPALLKMVMAAELLYGVTSLLVKSSLLVFFRRLLGKSNRKSLKRLTIACDFMILGIAISWIITVIFHCRPVQAYWAYSPSYPVICVSGMFIIVFASLMTITNFIVLVLPIFIVWKLQLPTRQRFIVTILLSLSLFACIAGLIRDILIVHALRSYDASWSGWSFGFAGVIEVDLGVICASAPAFWPFITHHLPGLCSSSSKVKPFPTPDFAMLQEQPKNRELAILVNHSWTVVSTLDEHE